MEVSNFSVRDRYKVAFDAALSREEWVPFLSKVSKELQKEEPIAGFRAGLAPVGVAEKRYGPKLYKAASKIALESCIKEVCREHELFPVSEPVVSIITADATGFSCLVRFEDYPKIDSMRYQGLSAEKPVRKCTEEEIDAEIDAFLRQHLYVHEVPREARMGDIAEVDFTGTREGGSFPYDHAAKYRLLLGSGRLFAGLDEVLCGHVAGDHLDVTLRMPEDFHRKDVAGSTLDLHVNLHGVWARDLQELSDDLVKRSVKGAETVAGFREMTRQKIQRRLDEKSERIYEMNLYKALADAVPIAIPGSMVKTVAAKYMNALKAFAAGKGKTTEQILAEEGKTLDDFKAQVEAVARQQAAVSVAVDYIISTERLTITRAELDDYYRQYAEKVGAAPEEVKQRLGNDEPAIIEKLLPKKAMQIVRGSAKTVSKEVDEIPEPMTYDLPS